MRAIRQWTIALIKVVALVTFLVVGIVFLAGRFKVERQPTDVSVISDHGGILPTGILQLVIIHLRGHLRLCRSRIGGHRGRRAAEPAKVTPKAINSVVFRIAVFYVGSLILLALLLMYTAYKQGTSPFVTFYSSIGVPAAGDIINFVVLTAALASLNAVNGSAPQFTARMTKRVVPFAGIALTACFTVVGVFLNLVMLGIIASWAAIVICQIQMYRWSKKGVLERPGFRLFGTPCTSYATLVCLFAVTALMCWEKYWNLIALVVIVPALIGGWYAVCRRWPVSASAHRQ